MYSLDIERYRCIKDKESTRLTRKEDILDRWREHFEGISNEDFPYLPIRLDDPVKGPISIFHSNFTLEKVQKALTKIKLNKVLGPDNIPTEFWQLDPHISTG